MISHTDLTFKLEFPVGKKYVAALFTLRKGEDTSAAVDQFMNEFDIPPYLRVSLLNMMESLLEQEYVNYNDNQDKEDLVKLNGQDIEQKIDNLAHQFSEKTHYWNSMVENEITEEQKASEEKIKMFLYLVQKSNETKEKIINQEEIYATTFNILLSDRKDTLDIINQAHAKEMQDAANRAVSVEEKEKLVSDNVSKLEQVEERFDKDILELKTKQKSDFITFLNDLYWLETTKDELDQVDESFNNIKQQEGSNNSSPFTSTPNTPNQTTTSTIANNITGTTTNEQSKVGVNILGSLDKVGQKASSFFNFGFGKKNQQPTTTTTNNTTNTTPSVSSPEIHSSQSKQIPTSNGNNDKQQQQPPNNNSFDKKENLLTKKSNPQQQQKQQLQNYYKVLESCTIAVGVQKKKLFEFKLIDVSPLQLCRPVSTGEYLKSKRMEYIQTLYSDSLSAVVLLADPNLTFSSHSEKLFIKYCNMSTELHFDSIDQQIDQFKQSIGDVKKLKNGDFFITKHSNLSDIQVVFHLLADSKNRTPWGENQLPTTSNLAKGLRNIVLTASKYGVGNLTIPVALTEAEIDMNITNNSIANRTGSILSVVRASLTSLNEMTSIKTLQFAIPNAIDGGNTLGQGPVSMKWKSCIQPFIYDTNLT